MARERRGAGRWQRGVRGLLRGQSVNEITAAMCAQAVATEKSLGIAKTGDAFFADGFGDNAPGWRA